MAEVVTKLNITAAELGENLLATYKKNDPEDDRMTPTEVAELLVDKTPGTVSPTLVFAMASMHGHCVWGEDCPRSALAVHRCSQHTRG